MYINDAGKAWKSGFTIVELLIVIVVIGILAAITIVAFRGMTARAQVSKAGVAVSSFQRLLNLYKADNGTYPHPGGSNPYMVCVGKIANYPATSGFAAGECGNTNIVVSNQLNTALGVYASSVPDGSLPFQLWDSGYPGDGGIRGIVYRYYAPGSAYQLTYKLPGIQTCPVSTSTSTDTGNGSSFTNCTVDVGF